MFYSTSDEDDGSGFVMGMPPSGSKLQSLFGADPTTLKDGNETLMYVPQKQPKVKNEMPQQSVEQKIDGPALMYACACHTFRYVNGQYANQGKLGLAVLGNFATKDYKLLVYASQKKAVTSAKIYPSFVFKVQVDNYATFYDDQSQNWSVCFDSEEHLFEAAKRVAIAKFNITPGAVVSQDLNCHVTQEIQNGDTVEVQYTGWLHDGNNFGKVFDSNESSGRLLKFKVGKGKVIKGLDLGILGMKKLSKRIIIVPPDLASESKEVGPKIPPNCALIFQIEVTRVKFVNPQQESDAISLSGQMENEKSGISEDTSEADVSTVNEALSVRTKSISEQLTKPENTKSKLLERMSKMGQSMVATVANVSNVSVEDDVDESDTRNLKSTPAENIRETSKPLLMPKPDSPRSTLPLQGPLPDNVQVPLSQQNLIYQQPAVDPTSFYQTQQHQQQQHQQQLQQQQQQHQQLALYQSPHSVQPALFGYSSVPQMAVPQVSSQPASMSSTEINLMLTDGRLKHTEIKTDLNRIVDKIDAISSRIGTLENANKQLQISHATTQQHQLFNQAPEMEASIIMQNITRIIKENEKLRSECEEKTKKIELLNEKMTDLLTKNQHFFEKSNQLLANQTDSMQNSATQAMVKVTHLEDQNVRLQTELATLRSHLVQAQGQKEAISKTEGHLTNKIESLTQELMHVKESADVANSLAVEKNAIIAGLQEKLKNGKNEQTQMQLQCSQLQEENTELKTEKESLNKILSDVKRKRNSEKDRQEKELEELKSQHEEKLKNGENEQKKMQLQCSQLQEENTELKTEKESLHKILNDVKKKRNSEKDRHEKELEELKSQHEDCDNAYDKGLKDGRSTVETISKACFQKGYSEGKESAENKKGTPPSPSAPVSKEKIADEVKKVMNSVFFKTKTEFEAGRQYDGKHVVVTLLNIIKEITLKMTAGAKEESDDSDEMSEEVSGDDEEEEDDEEHQEEHEEEQVESDEEEDNVVQTVEVIDSSDEIDNEDNTDKSTVQVRTFMEEESTKSAEEPQPQMEEVGEVESIKKSEDTDNENNTHDEAVSQIEDTDSKLHVNEDVSSEVADELHDDVSKEIGMVHSESAEIEVDVEPSIVHSEPVEIEVDIDPSVEPDPIKSNPESTVSIEPTHSDDVPISCVSIGPIEVPNDVPEITENITPVLTDSIKITVQEETFKTIEIDNDLIESTACSDINPEFNSSTHVTCKSSLGDSGDEHYATDEGECDNEVVISQSEDLAETKTTKSELISELLDIIDNNKKTVEPEGVDYEVAQKENVSDTGDKENCSNDHSVTNGYNQTLPSSDILHEEDKSVNDLDLPNEPNTLSITREVEVFTQVNGVDQPENMNKPDTSNIDNEDPLAAAISDSSTKSGSVDADSRLNTISGDEVNNDVANVIDEKKRNTLEYLGLGSSMFGVTKPQSDYVLVNNEDSKEIVDSSDSASLNSSKGNVKSVTSKEDSASIIKESIFDDDDSDDGDLFKPTVIKHKVSAFVRTPPPLFDDDDDDVNWI